MRLTEPMWTREGLFWCVRERDGMVRKEWRRRSPKERYICWEEREYGSRVEAYRRVAGKE